MWVVSSGNMKNILLRCFSVLMHCSWFDFHVDLVFWILFQTASQFKLLKSRPKLKLKWRCVGSRFTFRRTSGVSAPAGAIWRWQRLVRAVGNLQNDHFQVWKHNRSSPENNWEVEMLSSLHCRTAMAKCGQRSEKETRSADTWGSRTWREILTNWSMLHWALQRAKTKKNQLSTAEIVRFLRPLTLEPLVPEGSFQS